MEQELDIKDMKSFINNKIFLEENFFVRYEEEEKSTDLRFYNEEFSFEKIKFSNVLFSIVKINYKSQTDLIVEKELFDICSNPQMLKLNTDHIIYNFINNSHFSVGFYICLHFIENAENVYNFIENVRNINMKYNKPVQFLNIISFLILSEFEMCNKILKKYNENFKSSFSIIENYNLEGESFCVIKLEKGSALDIFCLGAYFVVFQKFE